MGAMIRLLTWLRILCGRLADTLRSYYWRSELRRCGIRAESGLVVKKGAAFSLSKPCQGFIGRNFVLGENARFYVGPNSEISIGHGVFVGRNSVVACRGHLKIGNETQIAHGVTLIDHDHDRQGLSSGDTGAVSPPKPISVGARAWIGAHAIVLKGTEIGDGAVVAAGAIVTKPVPAGGMARGRASEIL